LITRFDSRVVFLGDENPNGLAFYPTPKLGDFGLVVKTNLADTSNPGGLRGAGTPKYMPPVCFQSPKGKPSELLQLRNNSNTKTSLTASVGQILLYPGIQTSGP